VKYLLLLNNGADEVAHWTTLDPEEAARLREQEMPKWNAFFGWMGEQGLDGEGLELDDPREARVVRVVDGEPIVSDGPYAETKEVIGGYFVADCANLDQAIDFARRIPLVETGSVEIRPLAE
jgi:hypothetical protein